MDTSKILAELGKKLEEEVIKIKLPATWADLAKLCSDDYKDDKVNYSSNEKTAEMYKNPAIKAENYT